MNEGNADALGEVEVRDLGSAPVRVRSLWAERAALVVFLRHFGCPACSRAVTELSPRAAELEALGVGLACIGPGTPEQARSFLEAHGVGAGASVTVLADPDARAFVAAGMKRSAWATFGPEALASQAALVTQGFRIRGLRGDSSWLGGALLLERGGRVAAAWRSESIATTPRVGALIDAALALAARRAELVV